MRQAENWTVWAKKADFQEIGKKYGIDQVTARIMRNRDIITDEERRQNFIVILTQPQRKPRSFFLLRIAAHSHRTETRVCGLRRGKKRG